MECILTENLKHLSYFLPGIREHRYFRKLLFYRVGRNKRSVQRRFTQLTLWFLTVARSVRNDFLANNPICRSPTLDLYFLCTCTKQYKSILPFGPAGGMARYGKKLATSTYHAQVNSILGKIVFPL